MHDETHDQTDLTDQSRNEAVQGSAVKGTAVQEKTVQCPAGRITGVTQDGVATFHSVPFAHFPGPFVDSVPLTAAADIDARTARPKEVALTITAPGNAHEGSDLPVIVYIHGGRYEHGTHEDPRADGTWNARHGVVQVQLGYRVGLEGFARFNTDEPHQYRGINDCQLGLEWVQANIMSFGGDPTNVTLVGQSAGATTALWLSRKDHFRGAFRRLFVTSPCFPRASFEKRKGTLRTILGIPLTRDRLTQLQEKKPAKLKKAYKRFRSVYGLDMALGPHPLDCEQLAEVPIVIASMHDEYYDMPAAQKIDRARNPKRITKILSRFMGLEPSRFNYWWENATPADPERPASRFIGDAQTRRWVAQVAEHAPGRTWLAEFRAPDGHALHCADLRYLFGVHAERVPDSQSGQAAENINALLRRFAESGEAWSEYRPEKACLIINMSTGETHLEHNTLNYLSGSFPMNP